MSKCLFCFFIIHILIGCSSNAVIEKNKPVHYTNVVRVEGGLDDVSSILKRTFKGNSDEFYKTAIGIESQSEFDKVNSKFNLKQLLISEVNNTFFKEEIGVQRDKLSSTVLFDLLYGYIALSPSVTVKGKPARVFGDFSLVVSGNSNLIEITVSTQNLRVYNGYSCTLKEGFICGESATSLSQSPFEQSLILNYVKFLLNKNGLKTF